MMIHSFVCERKQTEVSFSQTLFARKSAPSPQPLVIPVYKRKKNHFTTFWAKLLGEAQVFRGKFLCHPQ